MGFVGIFVAAQGGTAVVLLFRYDLKALLRARTQLAAVAAPQPYVAPVAPPRVAAPSSLPTIPPPPPMPRDDAARGPRPSFAAPDASARVPPWFTHGSSRPPRPPAPWAQSPRPHDATVEDLPAFDPSAFRR